MKKHVGRPGKEPIIIEGIIPRIVPEGTWETVKARIGANQKNKFNKSHPDREYLLSGLVFCKDCESLIIGIP